MKYNNKRFKSLRPGNCFIHKNNVYIKLCRDLSTTGVNLKTGEMQYFGLHTRVSPIFLNLVAIFGTENITIPYFKEQ